MPDENKKAEALLSHSQQIGGLKFSFYVHKVGQTKLQELPHQGKLIGDVSEIIENYGNTLKAQAAQQ